MLNILENVVSSVAGTLILGAIGWFFVHKIANPIIDITRLRKKVHEELFYTANAGWNGTNMSDAEKDRLKETQESLRRLAAKISAIHISWPRYLIFYLKWKGFNPDKAAKGLTGLSNSVFSDRKEIPLRAQFRTQIEEALNLPRSYTQETIADLQIIASRSD